MIPDAAVEAAMEMSLRKLGLWGKKLPEGLTDARRDSLRELLEAAAPHMMAAPECDSCRHARVATETRRDIAAISEALARGPRG